jgi:plastocyanin
MNPRQTLIVSALLVAALTMVACGGSSYNPASPSPTPSPAPPSNTGADLVITITGMNGSQSFSPNPGSIDAGKKVVFYNADTIVHTATANGGAFDTGNIAPGGLSALITMPAAGSFPYHCNIHPTMVGTLNVTSSGSGS